MSGTPKTLEEMIEWEMIYGAASSFKRRMLAGFRDFLAQKFTAALFENESATAQKALTDLWESIFGEKLDSTRGETPR